MLSGVVPKRPGRLDMVVCAASGGRSRVTVTTRGLPGSVRDSHVVGEILRCAEMCKRVAADPVLKALMTERHLALCHLPRMLGSDLGK